MREGKEGRYKGGKERRGRGGEGRRGEERGREGR